MFGVRAWLGRVARTLPFRIAVALSIIAFHLAAMTHLGRERLGMQFNASPDNPPGFQGGRLDAGLERWDRLIVSRWDAAHYIALGLRGYRFCKDKAQLAPGEPPDSNGACQLHFYPGYPLLGAAVAAALKLPMDYALFGVSLVACFALSLMWTGRAMTRGLGVDKAYLSLFLLNVYSAAFIQIAIHTEGMLMALTMAAFVAMARRWWFAAALAAGAASAIRITGVGVGFAFCAAILVATLRDHPRPGLPWVKAGALMAVSGWGVMALMGYYWVRFGDPLVYAHSYQREYHHTANLWSTLFPDGRVLIQSIWAEPNDGVFLAAALLWFALGHRAGLRRFTLEGQVYWYVIYFGLVGISMVGSVDNAFSGCDRYMLTVLPLFFAMAGVMRHKPVVLALWIFMSATHYYNGEICFYESQRMGDRGPRCGFARNWRSEDLMHGKP